MYFTICCSFSFIADDSFYLFDSDNEYDEHQDIRLSAMIQQSCLKTKHNLEYDYDSITGWVLSLLPEIREDVAERIDGNARMAIEQVITKLHVPPNPNLKTSDKSLEFIPDIFWKEFDNF